MSPFDPLSPRQRDFGPLWGLAAPDAVPKGILEPSATAALPVLILPGVKALTAKEIAMSGVNT